MLPKGIKMSTVLHIPHSILNSVQKPARYTGQEWNSVVKDWHQMAVTWVLAFPDVYDVGMSHLGLKILYHVLNSRPDTAAERVFAPWPDMEEQMRRAALPLYTLESFHPVAEADLLGFTLQYELSYSNILNMLDLAGVPLLAAQRSVDDPLVVGGGPCAFNPEPLADFFDFFVLGEAEEAVLEVSDCVATWRRQGRPGGRAEVLRRLAGIAGVYVPAFYDVAYNPDGTVQAVRPNRPEAPAVVTKRVVQDLDAAPFPTRPVVPYLDIIHDRIMLEIFRGCTRGCRFCQAGVLYRPVRERRPDTLLRLAQELVANTGYNEISLVSLSSADYSCLHDLVRQLMAGFQQQRVSVSLPSLRIDSFSVQLAQEVQQVRRGGLTFAPEAGTQRLRDVINKGVTEADLRGAVTAAFKAGWSAVKLYFMIGLPTETQEDVAGIAHLAQQVLAWHRQVMGKGGAKVTVSVSSFVPKAHTAFQWFGQDTPAMLQEKQHCLKALLTDRRITFHWHDPQVSFLEGVFARGDRRLGRALLWAWRHGARFDGWSEHFRPDIWRQAFAATGLEPAFYAQRQRAAAEVLPWDHLSTGATKSFLWREWETALRGGLTADCRHGRCTGCGVCNGLGVSVVDWGEKI